MAEIGAVYDAKPVPRTAADILPGEQHERDQRTTGPVATNKWLTASVVKAPAAVIKRVFEQAQRRDRKHRRTWIGLVDGANHQIQRIRAEANARGVRDDHPRLRARPRIPLERSSTLLPRRRPHRRELG